MTSGERVDGFRYAWSLALFLCSCAMSPTDGTVIPSRSSPVVYQIVIPWPASDVYTEAARYRGDGSFSHWEREWTCLDCDTKPLGWTDGTGSDDYWYVERHEPIQTTITGGTGHWVRTGLASPKWKAKVRMFAAQLRTGDYYRVATFANTSAAARCILERFGTESGANVYTYCDTDTFEATVYASAD